MAQASRPFVSDANSEVSVRNCRDSADPGELMRTCPICGRPLAERKCKLFCPDPVCGYYLSCADFY